jgi:YidC/Oxa1 family membrane protein insertase
MSFLWVELIYRPLFNFLIFLYNVIPGHDIGIAIILLTIIIRLFFLPSTTKTLKAQKALAKLQPELEKIRQQYKDDKQRQTQEILKLYQENKVNPFGSCLPLLIQLPILIALYQVFIKGLASEGLNQIYPFIHNPQTINSTFLHFVDLSLPKMGRSIFSLPFQYWLFPLGAGVLQFIQSWLTLPKTKLTQGSQEATVSALNKQILLMMPIITIIIAIKLPVGLSLYWCTTTLFAIIQQWWINRIT